jgi:Methyltransferase domain
MSGQRTLYEARAMPIFQNRMHGTREEARACPTGDVVLVEDLDTGLIYNRGFDPARMVYDGNYQNEQAVSPLFEDHLRQVASIVEREMKGASLLEIGCGKGRFLELLSARGVEVTGIDPAYEGRSSGNTSRPRSVSGAMASCCAIPWSMSGIPLDFCGSSACRTAIAERSI